MNLRLPLALLALSTWSAAGEIRIPSDQPDLVAAIAAASPGDTILVQTSADQMAPYPLSVVIDKPLTIVGDPVCKLDLQSYQAAFELAGPGHGEVTLTRVSIRYFSSGDAIGDVSLFGGGFDTLNLIDSSIRQDNTSVTGTQTKVFPAVELTSVGTLNVIHSDLLGGTANIYYCGDASAALSGREGIFAPNTSVLVIDSTINGGAGSSFGTEKTSLPCTGDFPSWGARGGAGIIAKDLYLWNSTVAGGVGASWYYDPLCLGVSPLTLCGTTATGAPFVVSGTLSINACQALTDNSTTTPLGGSWDLDFDQGKAGCTISWPPPCPPPCTGYLYVAFGHPLAPFAFGSDWVFVDPSSAILVNTFNADNPASYSITIPYQPGLLGLVLTTQGLLSSGFISNPVSTIVTP